MEYHLLCDRAYLVCKCGRQQFCTLPSCRHGLGVIVAGVLSDRLGRRAALSFLSQLIFGVGIRTTIMPDIGDFVHYGVY